MLFLDSLHIAKSMRSVLNSNRFELRIDTAFEHVIQACADVAQPRARGFHKTSSKRTSDCTTSDLPTRSRRGVMANWSVDLWVSIGCMFLGKACSQQKATLQSFALFSWLMGESNGWAIDCQISNSHLLSLGAAIIPREAYAKLLRTYLAAGKTRRGKGQFTSNPQKFRSR